VGLSLALKTNETLMYIDLASNRIGVEGTHALAVGIMSKNMMQHIDLAYNCIGDSGAEVLATSFGTNTKVTHLNLWSNQITDVGMKASLEVNHALTHTYLGATNISPAVGKALAAELLSRRMVTIYL